jgi:hypothetical protein
MNFKPLLLCFVAATTACVAEPSTDATEQSIIRIDISIYDGYSCRSDFIETVCVPIKYSGGFEDEAACKAALPKGLVYPLVGNGPGLTCTCALEGKYLPTWFQTCRGLNFPELEEWQNQ